MTAVGDIWRRQAEQQLNWYDSALINDDDKATILDKLLLCLHEETGKLQRLVDRQRYHILRRTPPNVGNVTEAGVDITKILFSILQLHGVSSAAFVDEFFSKSDVVDDKWRREQAQLRDGEEVLAVDLDGCVADWVEGFMSFCAMKGAPIRKEQINEVWLEPLKDEYHRNGGFLTLGVIPGAREALEDIRAAGKKIVVLTARPYHQFKRIYADTMAWCKDKNVVYDHIIFKKDKAEAILSLAPATVIGHVEDRAKHALEVALAGIRVYKLPSYGGEKVSHPMISEVIDWAAIRELILHSRSEKQRDVT